MKLLKYFLAYVAGAATIYFFGIFVVVDKDQIASDMHDKFSPTAKMIMGEMIIHLDQEIQIRDFIGKPYEDLFSKIDSLSKERKEALYQLFESDIKTRLEFHFMNDISIIYCSKGMLYGPTESFTRLLGPISAENLITN